MSRVRTARDSEAIRGIDRWIPQVRVHKYELFDINSFIEVFQSFNLLSESMQRVFHALD